MARAAPLFDQAYRDHLRSIEARWHAALAATGFDAGLIAAGRSRPYFLDDASPPFRANPHLAQWLASDDCEHSLLLVEGGKRSRLFFYQPRDFWHQPPRLPEHVAQRVDVEVFHDPADLVAAATAAVQRINRVAYVSEEAPGSLPVSEHNPVQLLDRISFDRAYKTGFELACMRLATRRGVTGHLAAREAFLQGSSEFEIHTRYLQASGQIDRDTPYPNIVALNDHASVLHYQHYESDPPAVRYGLLIDAGARQHCYACDITRTYAAPGDTPALTAFRQLVADLDAAQLDLIAHIRPGVSYVELHRDMHRRTGVILADNDIVNCTAEAAFELGITRCFLPHGLGHLIGLQTHDVGGQQTSPRGGQLLPPAEYPALRLTRPVEIGQVFTIEPGLYFIPQLLDELRSAPHAGDVNWPLVEALTPYGGIRIEDNVAVTPAGAENLTREAFATK